MKKFSSTNKSLNQSGQMVTEMVLLLTVLVTSTILVANAFKSDETFKKLVSGPWQVLSGMIQNGVWATPANSMHLHPNSYGRHVTVKGDPVK